MRGLLVKAGWIICGILASFLLLIIVVGLVAGDLEDEPEITVTTEEDIERATPVTRLPSEDEPEIAVTTEEDIEQATPVTRLPRNSEDSKWQTQLAAVKAVLELPPAEKSEMEFHIEILGAMQDNFERISEDMVIDADEAELICFVHRQWTVQLKEAEEYIVSLDKPDLKGWLIDIQAYGELVDQAAIHCGDSSLIPSDPTIDQDLIKTPTVEDAWEFNRDREVVIERVGDKELAEELLNDPCFKGMGPIGAIWDIECQMRR